MAVILHNVVGLLHATMAVYYAYLDRIPVIIFGGSGPAAYDRRRPNIDWIHSANVQGNAVRDYTKWDAQPASLGSVPEVVARAYRVAMSRPQGPVYVALDAGMQEEALDEAPTLPDFSRLAVPSAIGPDPTALRRLVDPLLAARAPVLIPGYAGRDPAAFEQIPELAELLGAAVMDTGHRLNMPTRHPLSVNSHRALDGADCVLFIDVKDFGKPTQRLDSTTRTVRSRLAPGCRVLDLGFNDVGLSSWSEDYAALVETDVQVTADSAVALPMLLEMCRDAVVKEPANRVEERARRRDEVAARHADVHREWQEAATRDAAGSAISTARLAAEVWSVVKDYDWVLTAGTAEDWALRSWDFDRAYRHPGKSLGTATQIGISLGVALAHKGSGRLVVDLQPDGDLMFDVGALWCAAYHRLPLLVVTVNNRAYDNDWEHQVRMARQRQTPVERTSIGMEIDGPAPDFAAVAKGFSWYAEGPVTDPAEIAPAVRRAAEHVMTAGRPALVDVVCARRSDSM
jgi:benzoylformate decarboxylase/acetolactate synthase-1/2/3 large subunit